MAKNLFNYDEDFNEDLFLTKEEIADKQAEEPIEVDEVHEQIATAYRNGDTVTSIVTKYNTSWGKVYEVLARYNIPLRSGRRTSSKSAQRLLVMSSIERESIIKAYKEGMFAKDIYEKFDINKHGLYRILDEANIPRKQVQKPEKEEEVAVAVDNIIDTLIGDLQECVEETAEKIASKEIVKEEEVLQSIFENVERELLEDEDLKALALEYGGNFTGINLSLNDEGKLKINIRLEKENTLNNVSISTIYNMDDEAGYESLGGPDNVIESTVTKWDDFNQK